MNFLNDINKLILGTWIPIESDIPHFKSSKSVHTFSNNNLRYSLDGQEFIMPYSIEGNRVTALSSTNTRIEFDIEFIDQNTLCIKNWQGSVTKFNRC